jgi:rRNA maturation protein Nop10
MLLMKCPKCKRYTLDKFCTGCNENSISAHPPSFSLDKERKYGKYRRLAKAKV